MGGDGPAAARYWGFVSYSHKDSVQGRRLHAQLERYVLPRRLVGRETARGVTPRRLAPIFRDREEFPAAHDLGVEVRAALSVSRVLVVICSPNAAASPWVAREIELFRALHPDRPILAALIAGEPDTAFPAPLSVGAEPLAADFRPDRDGRRLALLKLVAGMAGVGLDELVQRDAQRRVRSVTAVTVVSVIAALTMGLLTAFALNARDEAERQRGESESLVEFMMTDLRAKLTPTQRLAVQSAVSQRALDYYAGQDPKRLEATSLARRARVLSALGADAEGRGDLATAGARLRESYAVSSRLLAAEPDNPQRLYDQAQNEYWLATVAYRQDRSAEARAGYERYRDLAGRLTRIRPDSIEYRQELGYAEGNLCTLAVNADDKAASARHCAASLKVMQDVDARMVEARRRQAANLINRHAWMAEAYKVNGDIARAIAERAAEEKILDVEMARHPDDRVLQGHWVALKQAQGGLAYLSGDSPQALAHLAAARARAADLIAFDADKAEARRLLARIDAGIAYVKQNPRERIRK